MGATGRFRDDGVDCEKTFCAPARKAIRVVLCAPSYSWRLLGEKPQLGVLNAAECPIRWCPGAGDFAACDTWEPRAAYIVEGTARLPYDSYSKRIIAIYKDAWVALSSDLYEQDHELWKTILCFRSYRTRTESEGAQAKQMSHLFLLSGSAIDLRASVVPRRVSLRKPTRPRIRRAPLTSTGSKARGSNRRCV